MRFIPLLSFSYTLTVFVLLVLKSEIAIMHTLSHPNIVGLKEVYDTSTNVYLVMELMKGFRTYCLLTAHCSLTAPSLLPHCSLTAPSLLPHCSLTAPSLLTALSLLSHCSLLPHSLLPHCSHRWRIVRPNRAERALQREGGEGGGLSNSRGHRSLPLAFHRASRYQG